jgi:hypothetical protein
MRKPIFKKSSTIAAWLGTTQSVPWLMSALLAHGKKKAIPPGAKSAYEYFSALWKDADRDIPILKQAKAKYAKLQ